MKRMTVYFFSILAFLFFFHLPVTAADFVADYDTQYAVSPSGTTIVTQNIILTNKQSTLYPTTYSITIDSTEIKNVLAYDTKGAIKPKVKQENGKTTIEVSFNVQVVGLGKTLPFTIRYENAAIATNIGAIWEIHIPGISKDPSIGSYTVTLQTPPSFPPLAYMFPQPKEKRIWTKDQLIESGIHAAFGEYQSFLVDVSYDLHNDSLETNLYEITLPANTSYQTVAIGSIFPKPFLTKRDEDGNWIAQYELAPATSITVNAQLSVKTTVLPKAGIISLTNEEIAVYLRPQKYWETQDARIQSLAKQLTTPWQIYEYVVNALTYKKDTNTLTNRKGAVGAIEKPAESVCTEFTDLFIAIARAAGIPAREVIGYAYTTDKRTHPLLDSTDILHAWPEYYDTNKKLWIPIDPTWGNTTGGIDYFSVTDFHHIAFVTHGISSEIPYPAGSFRQGSKPKKNVRVTFLDTAKAIDQTASFQVSYILPTTMTAGGTMKGSILIENTSGVNAENIEVRIHSSPLYFEQSTSIAQLQPFGTVSIPVSFSVPIRSNDSEGKIFVELMGEQSTFIYTIRPIIWIFIPIIVVGCGILLFLWTLLRKR